MNYLLTTLISIKLTAIVFFASSQNLDRLTVFIDRTTLLFQQTYLGQFVMFVGLAFVTALILMLVPDPKPEQKPMATKSKAQTVINSYPRN